MSYKISIGSIAHLKRKTFPKTHLVNTSLTTEQSSLIQSVVKHNNESYFVVPEPKSKTGLAIIRPYQSSSQGNYHYAYYSCDNPAVESVFIIYSLKFDDQEEACTATSFTP